MRTRRQSGEPRIGESEAVRTLAAEIDRVDRLRPAMGRPGWFPDHTAERRADFVRTTPAERVAEAIELSEVTTILAAIGARRVTGLSAAALASHDVRPLDARTLLRTLVEHEVDFVVAGGLAVAAHGFPHATKHLDIVPRQAHTNRRRLYDALATLDAQPIELGDLHPESPARFTPDGLDEGGNWALKTRAGRIDVVQSLAGVDDDEQLDAGAIDVELPDVGRIRVAGYEDLDAMKRAAGRRVDLADLEELERIRRP